MLAHSGLQPKQAGVKWNSKLDNNVCDTELGKPVHSTVPSLTIGTNRGQAVKRSYGCAGRRSNKKRMPPSNRGDRGLLEPKRVADLSCGAFLIGNDK